MTDDFSMRLGVEDDLDTVGDIDADAGTLFEEAGLFLDLPADHEFPRSERRRWQEALAARTTLIATYALHGPVGFAALGQLDGDAWLAQLSVRRRFMRRGLGRALLEASMRLAREQGHERLWLTTYGHLAWNRPFYERHGFSRVADESAGVELSAAHSLEKRWLPLPEQRVILCRRLR